MATAALRSEQQQQIQVVLRERFPAGQTIGRDYPDESAPIQQRAARTRVWAVSARSTGVTYGELRKSFTIMPARRSGRRPRHRLPQAEREGRARPLGAKHGFRHQESLGVVPDPE